MNIFARDTLKRKISGSSSETKSEVKPEKLFYNCPSYLNRDRTLLTRRAKFQMRTLQEKTAEAEKLINSEEITKEDLASAVQAIQQLKEDSSNILCSNVHIDSYRTKLSELKVRADQRMFQLLGADLAERCFAELLENKKTADFNKPEEKNSYINCATLRALSLTKLKFCSHKSKLGCKTSIYKSTRR